MRKFTTLLLMLAICLTAFAACESTHEHTYADTLSYDATGHWYAATCGCEDAGTKDFAEHTFTTSQDGVMKVCEACGYFEYLVTSLDAPASLAYGNDAVTFTAAQYATSYVVTLKQNDEVIKTEEITTTTYDVGGLAYGDYTVEIVAKRTNPDLVSQAATLNFTKAFLDKDVLLEAENAILNSAHYSGDADAYGGAYALGFDNRGQGMYYRYFAYFEGEREVDIAYATGVAGSYMNAYINGAFAAKAEFNENTGWFGDSKTFATTTIKVTFNVGWNELYLIKDGIGDADNWGGWAQIDYIVIKGTQAKINLDDYDTSANTYKLEAECSQFKYQASTVPIQWKDSGISMNYGLGEINTDGDGAKFTYAVKDDGVYKVELGYGGQGEFTVKVIINGEESIVTLNTSNGWNDIKPGTLSEGLTLKGGETFTIEIYRNGQWIVMDYLLLTTLPAQA